MGTKVSVVKKHSSELMARPNGKSKWLRFESKAELTTAENYTPFKKQLLTYC